MSVKTFSLKKALLFIACLAVVALFVRLGFWQLARAEQKLEIKASVEIKSQQLIDLNKQMVAMDDRFSGVKAEGRYLSDKTFLLDRQLLKGMAAYSVITPFVITSNVGSTSDVVSGSEKNNEQIILVNRGLIAATNDRGILPIVETPSALITLKGNLNYPTPEPEFWRDSFPIEKNTVWQFMDMKLLSDKVGGKLAPLVMELDKNLDHVGGYVRQWRAYDDQWVNRHRAYALQWFSMAIVFIGMCFFAFRSID